MKNLGTSAFHISYLCEKKSPKSQFRFGSFMDVFHHVWDLWSMIIGWLDLVQESWACILPVYPTSDCGISIYAMNVTWVNWNMLKSMYVCFFAKVFYISNHLLLDLDRRFCLRELLGFNPNTLSLYLENPSYLFIMLVTRTCKACQVCGYPGSHGPGPPRNKAQWWNNSCLDDTSSGWYGIILNHTKFIFLIVVYRYRYSRL